MSADLLARNCVKILNSLRDEKVRNLRRCKPRPPTEVNGAIVPAASAEEIAFYSIDLNATIDALNEAVDVIQAEFKRLTQPEEPPSEEENPKARSIY
jgi:CBS-domain-containing membrane protein